MPIDFFGEGEPGGEWISRTAKLRKPRLRFAGKTPGLIPPLKFQRVRMERMMFKNQRGALLRSQPVLDQCEVQILIAAVKFISHNRVPKKRQVNPDLMFAAGARQNS
jgi:hypothetical protein